MSEPDWDKVCAGIDLATLRASEAMAIFAEAARRFVDAVQEATDD